MNSPRVGLRVAALIFGIIFLGHLCRLLGRWDVQFGQFRLPQWPSAVVVVVFGFISVWLWWLSGKSSSR